MSAPRVVAVAPGSPAERAGLARRRRGASASTARCPATSSSGGCWPTSADVDARRRAGAGSSSTVEVDQARRRAARRRGVDRRCSTGSAPATTTASSASSTSCRQGLRPSLYLKDDDYRLSFLYGNFTTLTRFTEADLERVVDRGPVAAARQHPRHRPRGAGARCCATGGAPPACAGCGPCSTTASTVHGQVVVCPGVNDGAVLDDTLAGVLDQYPELAIAVRRAARRLAATTPSRRCGPTPRAEAAAVVDAVERLAGRVPRRVLGRRLVFAADEYYLLAGRPVPRRPRPTRASRCTRTASAWPARSSWSSPARSTRPPASQSRLLRLGRRRAGRGLPGAPQPGRRHRRCAPRARRRSSTTVASPAAARARSASSPGEYGAQVLAPLVAALGRDDVRVIPVANEFFGGNTGVTGLHGRRRPRPGARRPSPTATATCCPTSACPRAASSTAPRRPTCPGRSRSSPPTASRCARALDRSRSRMSVARRRRRRPAQRRQVARSSTASSASRWPSSRTSPGVTRDRKELEAEWLGVAVPPRRHRRLAAGRQRPRREGQPPGRGRPCASADVVLFVVDATVGVTEEDAGVADVAAPGRQARAARRQQGRQRPARAASAGSSSSLGLGEPYPVSALHGRRTGDLLDEVVARLPDGRARPTDD